MTSWYGEVCDESKRLKSNSRKHNDTYSTLVKVYEFDDPDENENFSIIENVARDCHIKHFHSFTFNCI